MAARTTLTSHQRDGGDTSIDKLGGARSPDLGELRKTLVKLRGLRQDMSKADWLLKPMDSGDQLWLDHYQKFLDDALQTQFGPAIRRLSASKPLPQRVYKIVDAMMVLSDVATRKSSPEATEAA